MYRSEPPTLLRVVNGFLPLIFVVTAITVGDLENPISWNNAPLGVLLFMTIAAADIQHNWQSDDVTSTGKYQTITA